MVDEKMRAMIHDGAAEHLLEEYARSRSDSLQADGIRRVVSGDTSLNEVLRVSQSD